jgi:predicted permease
LWYVGHLLTPSTWALVFKLRSRTKAARGAGNIGASSSRQSNSTGRRKAGKLGLHGSLLDFKLGFRMLLRYPGLTALGGVAMAFAIFTGAGSFELLTQVAYPILPLPEGDRIVGIQLWDAARGRTEGQVSFDVAYWRGLESIEDVGAFRNQRRNFITGDGPGSVELIAQVSASAFRVASVPPHLGRFLREEDEIPGAPSVVVIGYDIWQSRLAADPEVIGKTVRLGRVPTTVVGVMPEGFRFPVTHDLWIPMLSNSLAYEPRKGPGMRAFGRLAPGATLLEAQAELTALGDAIAAEFPATHEHLRPQVLPYPRSIVDIGGSLSTFATSALFLSSNLPLVLFLVLVCGNVALLMFARAVAREGELVVRSALGASRGRIVIQLFTEALVLAAAAAVVGLATVSYGLREAFRMIEGEVLEGAQLPFWFHPNLSPLTVVYAGLLTVIAAAVAGVVPALKVTRGIGAQLQRASAAGGGFRFGGMWTAVVVCQIVVTMVFPLFTVGVWAEMERVAVADIGIATTNYLGARLEMDQETGPDVNADSARSVFQARYQTTVQELEERLVHDPQVAGVTFGQQLPRLYHPWRQIEVDGPSATPRDERGHRLGSTSVAIDYFEVLDIEVRLGRDFDSRDLDTDAGVVIVNESFVRRILGNRNPIGQRVRYLASEEYRSPDQDPGPWLEIVGVVEDLGTISGYGPQGMYHAAGVGDVYPVNIVVRVKGDAKPFTPQLQRLALAVDPTLRVHDVLTLREVTNAEQQFYGFWFALLFTLTSTALLLSLGGIYAIMSFTVVQRTREIGIRMALGSSRTRVVGAVLRRPFLQVLIGISSGWLLLFSGSLSFDEVGLTLGDVSSLVAYALFMMAVCLLACIIPTRRAVSVEPCEALRAE